MNAYLFHALSGQTPSEGSIMQKACAMPLMIVSGTQSGHTYQMNTSPHFY